MIENRLQLFKSPPYSKKYHRLIDCPLCVCVRIETTKHYLFVCNKFNEFPQEMMQEISPLCEPTLDTLLYGNREFSHESNGHILIRVQEFLIKDKRFK